MRRGGKEVCTTLWVLGTCFMYCAPALARTQLLVAGTEGGSASIRVRSALPHTLAVQVRMARVLDAGAPDESLMSLDGQDRPEISVSPARFLLAPRVSRAVQVVNRWPVDKEAVYELTFESVSLGADHPPEGYPMIEIGHATAPNKVRLRVVPDPSLSAGAGVKSP